MPAPETLLDLYLSLAEVSEDKPSERETFLALAASAAELAGHQEAAEACRGEILRINPRHFLADYGTMADALQSEDAIERTEELYRHYHFERAEFLLERYRNARAEHPEPVPAWVAEIDGAADARSPAAVRSRAMPTRETAPTVEVRGWRPPAPESFAGPERQVPLGAALVLALVAFAVGFLACGTLQLIVK